VENNQLIKTVYSEASVAVHAGAGPDSPYVRDNLVRYETGLQKARDTAFDVIQDGGTALDAVASAVAEMEDNPIFNAGRGSALNNKGEVQMYASVMEGSYLRAGAVCLLSQVKNPVLFAKHLLEGGKTVFLGGPLAEEYAAQLGIAQEPLSYFVTELQVQNFLEERERCRRLQLNFNPAVHGTVGCVARDRNGHLAAATSTGGTIYSQPGRIGDTSMLGAGTYADDRVCAISCTGDGDALIRHVLAHSVFSIREYLQSDMQGACDYLFLNRLRCEPADMGCIAVDFSGRIGMAFNTPRMHRAWRTVRDRGVAIYR